MITESSINISADNCVLPGTLESINSGTVNVHLSELEEMDFESLESIVIGPKTRLSSEQGLFKPGSVQMYPRSTIFTKEYMKNLRDTSDVVERLANLQSPRNNQFRGVVGAKSTEIVSGTKRPSHLGSVICSTLKQKPVSVEYILLRCGHVLCRCRGSTMLSMIYPRRKLLKPFDFDLPEPVTFESRQKVSTMGLKSSLPAPRNMRRTHGT